MKTWRRRLQLWLFWGVSSVLIVAAVLVGLIQLALPWWASDPDRVARLLSSRLGSPVSIESTDPRWGTRGPVVALRGVRFGEGADALRIDQAAWAVDFAGLILPGRVFNEFRVQGLDLTLLRHQNGTWEVQGLPDLLRGDTRRSLSGILRALPAFAVRDSRLQVRYSPTQPAIGLQLAELRWVGGDDRDRWRGRLRPLGADDDAHDLTLGVDLAAQGRGRVHLAADSLRLDRWLADDVPMPVHPTRGRLDLQAWLEFDDQGVHDVQLELALSASAWRRAQPDAVEPEAATPASEPVQLPALGFGARWQRTGPHAALLVDGLTVDGQALGHLVGRIDQEGVRLRAESLELAPLQGFAELALSGSDAARQAIRQAQPTGRIEALDVGLVDGHLRQYAVRLADLQVQAAPGQPGVKGLDLRLIGDAEGLTLWPESTGVVLEYPGVLAAPVTLDIGAGVLVGWRDEDGWRIEAEQLPISGEGFQVALAGGLHGGSDEPMQIDLGVQVGETQIEAVKAFWPLNRIPNTARWLNRSLRGGRIVSAAAWVRGPVGPFPFPDGSGHFEAVASVAQAGLDYHAEWPGLRDIRADLTFENMSLGIQSDRARMADVAITRSQAWVEDLKMPVMEAQGEGRGDGRQLLDLLRRTPVQKRFGEHIDSMSLDGPARAEVTMRLPLKKELGESTVDGRVTFDGTRFRDSEHNLDFTDLDGELRFDRDSVSVSGLAVRVAGEPARLDLRLGDTVVDARHLLEAGLSGRLGAAALFGQIAMLQPVVAAMQGSADWQVRMEVPRGDADIAPGARLRVDSDLRGISLALPAPLAKSRGSVLPLHVDTRLAPAGAPRPLDVRIGRLLHMRARLPGNDGGGFAGAVALGGASPEQIPPLGLSISGQVPAFDLTGWLALNLRDEDASTTTWPPMMLRAGELGVFGRAFRDVDLQMTPADGVVRVVLRGPDIDGSIHWPKASAGRVVQGRFTRVFVPEAGSAALGGDLDPAAMPALDIEAEDVRIGNKRLGHTVLVATPADGVFNVQRFESRNPAFDLDANGEWRKGPRGDVSEFDIRLRAPDLGGMLESFGFAGLIEGGRTTASIVGSWAGSPAAFALENIDGKLILEVGSGRITDVDPGVGRLFGLLNLREIPRRLVLDFRDIFSQGMRFNSIEGSFALDVGEAYTDNVTLKSPSADILITGRTGLILRDYDQTLEVTPRVGGTLPVVGVIAGGPAGAAAGLLMQGLMRAHKVSRMVYRVTGPWDEPVIIKHEPISGTPQRQRADGAALEPAS